MKREIKFRAVQFNGENSGDVAEFIGMIMRTAFRPEAGNPNGRKCCIIQTADGEKVANVGDWVITGNCGDLYVAINK